MPKSLGKLKVNSMGGVVPSIRMISIRFLHDRYKGWRTSLEPTISNMGICVYLDMYVYIYIYIQNAYIYTYMHIYIDIKLCMEDIHTYTCSVYLKYDTWQIPNVWWSPSDLPVQYPKPCDIHLLNGPKMSYFKSVHLCSLSGWPATWFTAFNIYYIDIDIDIDIDMDIDIDI